MIKNIIEKFKIIYKIDQYNNIEGNSEYSLKKENNNFVLHALNTYLLHDGIMTQDVTITANSDFIPISTMLKGEKNDSLICDFICIYNRKKAKWELNAEGINKKETIKLPFTHYIENAQIIPYVRKLLTTQKNDHEINFVHSYKGYFGKINLHIKPIISDWVKGKETELIPVLLMVKLLNFSIMEETTLYFENKEPFYLVFEKSPNKIAEKL